MSSEKLAEATGLIERAVQTMEQVRTQTPVGYMEDDAARDAFMTQMRSVNDDLENAVALTVADGEEFTPEEWDAFSQINAPARRTFSYLTVEHHAGRLPQLPEAPWPPYEWVQEDNMRAEAEEAAAEPATNGYEEVSDAQGAVPGSDGG